MSVSPTLRVAAVWLLVAACAGCTQRGGAGEDLGPTPPLMMTPDSAEQARAWHEAWMVAPRPPAGSPIREAGLIGIAARSGEAGTSRALCRFALSSAGAELVRRDGGIRIILLTRPGRSGQQFVGTWELTAQTAGEHFRYGRLPSYQLDLLWPRVTGASTYRLIVRWDDPDSDAHQITTISFEDTFGYDTRTQSPIR